jgi:hypothetical protein
VRRKERENKREECEKPQRQGSHSEFKKEAAATTFIAPVNLLVHHSGPNHQLSARVALDPSALAA